MLTNDIFYIKLYNIMNIKVLIAKPGLDGHDRGAKVVAKYLRDAGMEVVYTGLRQTPETIANTAIHEDVQLVGLSVLSGAHLQLCEKFFGIYNKKRIIPPPVFIGGIIPEEDISKLKKLGVKAVFLPGTPLENIRLKINELIR